MRTQKIGAVLLTIWSGLNFLVAAAVTVVTFAGGRPPALRLVVPEAELTAIDPRAIAVINTQAAIANPIIMAVCALTLVLTWRGVRDDVRWAVPTLAAVLIPVQAFGFASDSFIGNHNLVANSVSTAVLLAGLALARPAR